MNAVVWVQEETELKICFKVVGSSAIKMPKLNKNLGEQKQTWQAILPAATSMDEKAKDGRNKMLFLDSLNFSMAA